MREWTQDADVLAIDAASITRRGRLMTPTSVYRGRFYAPLLCTTAIASLIGRQARP
jgi:hypothetical protein